MLDPASLYSYEGERPSLVDPPLVVALSGFVDAGNAVRLSVDHLLETCRHEVVATFDVDQLHDYRARRPTMTFGGQNWLDVEPPRLRVLRVFDEEGSSFLLLTGPEPDVQWERFTAAVWNLADELGVGLTMVLSAAPTAVPHTRPSGVTASASRPELLEGYRTWDVEAQVPGHASALLHLRGSQAGRDVVSVLAHVPHYLGGSDHPDAAAVLVRTISGATGVSIDVQALQEAASQTRVEVDRQVAESPEAAAVVTALEEQYDAFGDEGRGTGAASAFLPTADELGEEFERFLAKREEEPGEG
ncbi:proteasome assembly chaperone family protein [Kineococcus rhizosphaerae]|uniref:Putative ATP-grasp superfamily ATP-dependent carboligase n=1 Tax=Kineococcus rhizosphaerae TaxID=559628 RepID=A0A2T0RBF9_9ACTN|nr:PAC2 family protein [Kineococcus rhizosphaerae]PRY18471.1 putative ATP-grasp superfamily ATP-dependent carboligase [Kineococcus rhizosphaerae]